MVAHQVDSSGTCSSCETDTNESEVLQCVECQQFYHAVCDNSTPYGSKTFITQFKKVKVDNYLFFCDICKTKREYIEASDIRRQLNDLVETIKGLSKEVFSLKTNQVDQRKHLPIDLVETIKELSMEIKTLKNNQVTHATQHQPNDLVETVQELAVEIRSLKDNQVMQITQQPTNVTHIPSIPSPWKDQRRTENVKSSLLIKSNGVQVDMKKVNELATNNSIQVTKTTVKENGDVYVDMPSKESQEKLAPLLADVAGNENIVQLKSKLPTISILDVSEFTSKEDFIEKVKQQNPRIKEKIDQGSEFSIVFCRKPNENAPEHKKFYQVVVRVSDDIRQILKQTNNKIYMDLHAHLVVDRFYIKRCNRCEKFGHYQKDCPNTARCGYCMGAHLSSECREVDEGDHQHYKCGNCKDAGKKETGHSTHWHKCPEYIEQQKKAKKTIPYYDQKNSQ